MNGDKAVECSYRACTQNCDATSHRKNLRAPSTHRKNLRIDSHRAFLRSCVTLVDAILVRSGTACGQDVFQQLLNLSRNLWILEVILQCMRVLLHLVQNTAHCWITEYGLYIRICHCTFADLIRGTNLTLPYTST
ncbi:unnamed protein product [Leptidea sinapis]|uniref:Uncharacterized protein n=1 Tax=Leptidea sinapis TaxID=189913 RepID=A0A5E4QZ34_9NEOP|nr:unnamed protein product [Leptidea sinapis]